MARHGSYRLEATVQASASALDRKRLAAEALVARGLGSSEAGPGYGAEDGRELPAGAGRWRDCRALRSPFRKAPSAIRMPKRSNGGGYQWYEQALYEREFKLRMREAVRLMISGGPASFH